MLSKVGGLGKFLRRRREVLRFKMGGLGRSVKRFSVVFSFAVLRCFFKVIFIGRKFLLFIDLERVRLVLDGIGRVIVGGGELGRGIL